MITGEQEFRYAFLDYHPTSHLGDLGDRMNIALVAAPSLSGRAKLWVLKGRLAAVPVFGGDPDDRDLIEEFLKHLKIGLGINVRPEVTIRELDADFKTHLVILRFSTFRSLSGASLDAVPKMLGLDVEE